MIDEHIYSAERYAHKQAVLDATIESLKYRSQRNAGWLIAGLLALLLAMRWMG